MHAHKKHNAQTIRSTIPKLPLDSILSQQLPADTKSSEPSHFTTLTINIELINATVRPQTPIPTATPQHRHIKSFSYPTFLTPPNQHITQRLRSEPQSSCAKQTISVQKKSSLALCLNPLPARPLSRQGSRIPEISTQAKKPTKLPPLTHYTNLHQTSPQNSVSGRYSAASPTSASPKMK